MATSGCATDAAWPAMPTAMWFMLLAYNLRRADRLLAGTPAMP